jgi:hypothetical protein
VAAVRKASRILKDKSLASLRRATAAYNGVDDDGRQTTVLLMLQHACEMLLKAGLREKGVNLFDRTASRSIGRSVGYEKCVRLSSEHLKLAEEQQGTLRAIDSMRDDEQHWIADVDEGLLYLHARAVITLVDEVLAAVFSERLADHLPSRVLPISTDPPADIDVLINAEFDQVKELLKPGKRRRAEARAKIRTLLALESHVSEDVVVNERDVNRVMRGVREGKGLFQVFPRLGTLGTEISSEGPSLTVHFTKRQGAPVHFISADDPREAAAVREVDLQRKYYMSAAKLAERLELTEPRALALRRHLQIDDDEDCVHEFVFGSQRHRRYSDNALVRMKETLPKVDMAAVWEEHRPRPR